MLLGFSGAFGQDGYGQHSIAQSTNHQVIEICKILFYFPMLVSER
jgi:hypothetical protein